MIFLEIVYLGQTFLDDGIHGNAWFVLVFAEHKCERVPAHGTGGVVVQTPKGTNNNLLYSVRLVAPWIGIALEPIGTC